MHKIYQPFSAQLSSTCATQPLHATQVGVLFPFWAFPALCLKPSSLATLCGPPRAVAWDAFIACGWKKIFLVLGECHMGKGGRERKEIYGRQGRKKEWSPLLFDILKKR